MMPFQARQPERTAATGKVPVGELITQRIIMTQLKKSKWREFVQAPFAIFASLPSCLLYR